MSKAPPGWYPRRGEVYLIRLDKDRPALVLSSDALNRHALDVCVVPITSVHHGRFALRVALRAGDGGLRRESWAKCDQVTTLEKQMVLYPPLGRLSTAALQRVEEGVRLALELS
jgi:mRNA interferase MazF